MSRRIRIIALLLALATLPIAMFGCNDNDTYKPPVQKVTQKPTEKSTAEPIVGTPVKLADNVDRLKIWGRHQVTASGVACDHTASGIEFCGTMKGKVYIDVRCDAPTYFTVFVDGVRQSTRFYVSGGRRATTLKIAELSNEGAHTIRILKQTESRYSSAEFQTLTIDGTLSAPPAQKDMYIEFIGDSLTCGMGNLGTNKNTSAQNAAYEDGTYSYAFLTAEALDADYSIISQSGIGIAGSWFDPIQDYYTRTSYNRDPETMYDFARVPDMVVINLGTNDFYLNRDKDPTMCTPDQVFEKTKELITLVRTCYGEDVPIVWGYDFCGECMYDTVRAAIEDMGGVTTKIYTCKLTGNTRGGEGHPNQAGHMMAADDLKAFILSIKDN